MVVLEKKPIIFVLYRATCHVEISVFDHLLQTRAYGGMAGSVFAENNNDEILYARLIGICMPGLFIGWTVIGQI